MLRPETKLRVNFPPPHSMLFFQNIVEIFWFVMNIINFCAEFFCSASVLMLYSLAFPN